MTHIRKQVRDAAAAALSGATAAGSNVFKARFSNLKAHELPALKLYTPDDLGGVSESGGNQRRGVALTIEIVAAKGEGAAEDALMDALDALAEEVETVIAADPTLGGAAADTVFEAAQWAGVDSEATIPVGLLTMTFRVDTDLSGAPAKSGRFAVVKADGAPIGRLRGFSLSTGTEPADVSHSRSAWRERKASPGALNEWLAEVAMTLDDSDAGQMKLIIGTHVPFEFFPRGEGPGITPYAGTAVVANVDEDIGEDGDVVRTATLIGAGAITGA